MVMLARPRPGDQPPRKPPAPRVFKVRGVECPTHGESIYMDTEDRRVFCPACERYRPAGGQARD